MSDQSVEDFSQRLLDAHELRVGDIGMVGNDHADMAAIILLHDRSGKEYKVFMDEEKIQILFEGMIAAKDRMNAHLDGGDS